MQQMKQVVVIRSGGKWMEGRYFRWQGEGRLFEVGIFELKPEHYEGVRCKRPRPWERLGIWGQKGHCSWSWWRREGWRDTYWGQRHSGAQITKALHAVLGAHYKFLIQHLPLLPPFWKNSRCLHQLLFHMACPRCHPLVPDAHMSYDTVAGFLSPPYWGQKHVAQWVVDSHLLIRK